MRKRIHTIESLSPAVEKSTNYTSLLRNLNLKVTGGNHRLIKMRVLEYGIDTSHFTGAGWNRGQTKETNSSLKQQSLCVRMPDGLVFCENSGFGSSKLYDRLIELGWKAECSICYITDWLGKFLRFHVDHKNGIHTDNRLNNLRIVCPNCHQQTDTWGVKNKRA